LYNRFNVEKLLNNSEKKENLKNLKNKNTDINKKLPEYKVRKYTDNFPYAKSDKIKYNAIEEEKNVAVVFNQKNIFNNLKPFKYEIK
jgi:hypothetical protein